MKDIFDENKISPVFGLLKRYEDRVLIELTLKCPFECEFCFRKWKKNQKDLNFKDLDLIFDFLSKEKNINQIILSGGEPFLKTNLVEYCFKKIKKMDGIKTVRIHTRAVVSKPELISKKVLNIIKKSKKVVYISVHINNVDELSQKVRESIIKLRKSGAIIYSQSVFLKGINDSAKDLKKLFLGLVEIGVRPYNIYHCNRIKGLEKFFVPIKKEVEIMTELRKQISGLACPNLIFDVPENANKIPVPLNFWEYDQEKLIDFDGREVKVD